MLPAGRGGVLAHTTHPFPGVQAPPSRSSQQREGSRVLTSQQFPSEFLLRWLCLSTWGPGAAAAASGSCRKRKFLGPTTHLLPETVQWGPMACALRSPPGDSDHTQVHDPLTWKSLPFKASATPQ